MRVMRIAQVAPVAQSVSPAKSGSIEAMTALLVDGLVSRGHEVTLFAPRLVGDAGSPARRLPARLLRGHVALAVGAVRAVQSGRRRRARRRLRRHPLSGRYAPISLGVEPLVVHSPAADAPPCAVRLRKLRSGRSTARRPSSRSPACRRTCWPASTWWR